MHSMKYLRRPELMAAVITSQSQSHEVRGHSASGERIRVLKRELLRLHPN